MRYDTLIFFCLELAFWLFAHEQLVSCSFLLGHSDLSCFSHEPYNICEQFTKQIANLWLISLHSCQSTCKLKNKIGTKWATLLSKCHVDLISEIFTLLWRNLPCTCMFLWWCLAHFEITRKLQVCTSLWDEVIENYVYTRTCN